MATMFVLRMKDMLRSGNYNYDKFYKELSKDMTADMRTDLLTTVLSFDDASKRKIMVDAINRGIDDEYKLYGLIRAYASDKTGTTTRKYESTLEKYATIKVVGISAPESVCTQLPTELCASRREFLYGVVKRIHSAALTKSSSFIVLTGKLCSGRTYALQHLQRALSEQYELKVRWYEERTSITSKLKGVEPDYKDTVLIIDNLDDELEKPSFDQTVLSILRSGGKVIATASSAGRVKKAFGVYVETRPLPEFTLDDIIMIIQSRPVHGYSIDTTSLHMMIRTIRAYGTDNLLKDVVAVTNELLYPILVHAGRMNCTSELVNQLPFRKEEIIAAANSVLYRRTSRVDYSLDSVIERLSRKVIGQSEIIAEVAPLVAGFASGSYDPDRPAGVMLFFGPSGVGKTELARTIADEYANGVFHKEDMNLYAERHVMAKLTGSPPGYVGYSDVPPLMNFLDSNRRGVLLLDEIEKAHPDVIQMLMELFDNGTIVDNAGNTHSARGFLIIMTSNLATASFKTETVMGFNKPDTTSITCREKVARCNFFKPEVLARIGLIGEFCALNDTDLSAIARSLLNKALHRTLMDDTDDSVKDALLEDIVAHYVPEQGARSMRNYIDVAIVPKLLYQN